MKLKTILFALLAVCVIVICSLSTALRRANQHLTDAEQLIEIQHSMIEKLGSMDAVNATISVNVTNRATFGTINAGDIEVVADQILRYTRKELLQPDTLCKTIQQYSR